MPRLTYLAGVALVLVGGGLALTHELLGPWPGVTEANVRRIQPGMTLAQVEATLGAAAPLGDGAGGWFTYYLWPGADGEAVVCVRSRPGDLGEVAWAKFQPSPGPTPFQRLRAWLGR